MASAKKKTFVGAHEEYGKEQEGQPFGQYDDEIFAALDRGQVDSGNLPIMSIWADKTQPRNIIPREIHGGWTGSPAAMPEILSAWLEAIYDTGFEGDIEEILLGKQGSDKTHSLTPEGQEPLVQKFLPILTLAAQIRDVGLRTRIGVIETSKKEYRIIFGERRWTAFHLLRMFLGDGYANIPAQIARVTEWELAKIQASENFHQNPLNAIGKARQLAKLLILARKTQQDPSYDSWDSLVVEGGCNRPYFAQVWDGNKHPIPYGMGQEFERTLNISTAQMRQYRALLALTGDYEVDNKLWDMGDNLDWAEGFMRSISELGLPVIKKVFQEADNPEEMFREAVAAARADKRSVTIVTDSNAGTPDKDEPKGPFGPAIQVGTGTGSTTTPEPFKYGDEVISPDGPGRIINSQGNIHLVRHEDGRSIRFAEHRLQHKPKSDSWFNRYVQNPTGGVGVVVADLVEFCDVLYADGGRANIHKMYLSEVSKEEYDAAVQRHKDQVHQAALSGNWLNKYVRTPQGVAGVIRNIDAFEVQVIFPDGDKLSYLKTQLTKVDKAEWDAAVAALEDSIDGDDEQEDGDTAPVMKFKIDDRVLVQVGIKGAPGTVRYIKPGDKNPYGVFFDHSRSTHYYAEWMLSPLVEETQRDSDNANSVTPGDDNPEMKPRDWVGKPALYKENDAYKIPVFVQEFLGSGMLRVTSNGGKSYEVHFSQLEAVEPSHKTLSEFMSVDPDADHSDLLGRRVRLNTNEIGKVTQVDGNRVSLEFTEFVTGSALIEHIVEVLEDDQAEETKAITDVETMALLRHIGHIARRETTILKLLGLTRQNAIDAHKAEKLQGDLQIMRDSIKLGLEQLLDEVEGILDGIITDAEEAIKE